MITNSIPIQIRIFDRDITIAEVVFGRGMVDISAYSFGQARAPIWVLKAGSFMAIHLDVSQTRLHLVLQSVYRVLAMLWLVKGFWGWAGLVGAVGPGLHLFQADFDPEMVMSVVFAILDLIAGVALWMSWRWGAGVWFLIATAFGFSALSLSTALTAKLLAVISLILVTAHLLRIFFVRAQPEKRLTIV